MNKDTAGQEAGQVQDQAAEDLRQYTDDVIENVMTDEQRNDYVEGREITWTKEQIEALGEDVQDKEESGEKKPVGPSDVLGVLDQTIQADKFVESRAENTVAFQKLRKRAQAAEKKAQNLEKRNLELETESKVLRETGAGKAGEKEYNFDNPDDVEQFIKDTQEASKKPEDKPPEPPEIQILPDDYVDDTDIPRFFDENGNVYDEFIDDNPTGKAVFQAKTKAGQVVEITDRKVLADYDTLMRQRYGDQLYLAMWGTQQTPGPMAIWRDRAPKGEVMAVLNSNDPLNSTLFVYRSILAALQQQQAQQQGAQPSQQPAPQPGPQPHSPAQPQQRQARQHPRGFGAGPTTEQDLQPKAPSPIEIPDKAIRDMEPEDRDAWLREE